MPQIPQFINVYNRQLIAINQIAYTKKIGDNLYIWLTGYQPLESNAIVISGDAAIKIQAVLAELATLTIYREEENV